MHGRANFCGASGIEPGLHHPKQCSQDLRRHTRYMLPGIYSAGATRIRGSSQVSYKYGGGGGSAARESAACAGVLISSRCQKQAISSPHDRRDFVALFKGHRPVSGARLYEEDIHERHHKLEMPLRRPDSAHNESDLTRALPHEQATSARDVATVHGSEVSHNY